jgi:hypothetical protein
MTAITAPAAGDVQAKWRRHATIIAYATESRRGETVTAIIAPATGDVQSKKATPPVIAPAAGAVQGKAGRCPQSTPPRLGASRGSQPVLTNEVWPAEAAILVGMHHCPTPIVGRYEEVNLCKGRHVRNGAAAGALVSRLAWSRFFDRMWADDVAEKRNNQEHLCRLAGILKLCLRPLLVMQPLMKVAVRGFPLAAQADVLFPGDD